MKSDFESQEQEIGTSATASKVQDDKTKPMKGLEGNQSFKLESCSNLSLELRNVTASKLKS